MSRKFCIAIFLWIFATLSLRADTPRPHIIFILADDFGPGDMGFTGGKIAKTPNLDRIASEGIVFDQYYSAAPICSPSRCGLITGQFPQRWQIHSYLQTRKGNRDCGQVDFLDPTAPALPRLLQQTGYKTAHFGKWHLGGGRDVTNAPKFAAYGYNEHAGTWESPQPHPDITSTNWIWAPSDKVKRWDRTAFFVDKTLDFLSRHQASPCFVNLWLDDPHTPWVPAENATKGDNRPNLKMVMEENDRQIGRLLEGIKKLGLNEKTLVIFTSDNGPLPTFQAQRTLGRRGSKLSLFEGGIRQPLAARWPGTIEAGKRNRDTVMTAVDMLPTLAAIAKVDIATVVQQKSDGEPLHQALLGQAAPARQKPIFWEYGRNATSYAYPNKPEDKSPTLAMRQGDWKLLANPDGTGLQLFDLKTDPNETTDLSAKESQTAQRLKAELLAWKASLPQNLP